MVSKMIYTLTLNPAIDRAIYIDELNKKDVTRVKKTLRDGAGKGINVSKVLKSLDTESTCFGFIAGANGEFIKNELTKRNIKHSFIDVFGETRENIKVIIKNKDQVLELNESGPDISKEAYEDLLNKMKTMIKEEDILVISGSVPKGLHEGVYNDIIKIFNHAKIILDVSGKLFEESVEAAPFLIKPNHYELELYSKKTLKTDQEVINVCHTLLEKGIKHIVVSLGKKGSLYVSKDKELRVITPELNAINTVGAGDSLVAGLAQGFSQGLEIEDILINASSIGSASVLSENTAQVNTDDIQKIKQQIKLERI